MSLQLKENRATFRGRPARLEFIWQLLLVRSLTELCGLLTDTDRRAQEEGHNTVQRRSVATRPVQVEA